MHRRKSTKHVKKKLSRTPQTPIRVAGKGRANADGKRGGEEVVVAEGPKPAESFSKTRQSARNGVEKPAAMAGGKGRSEKEKPWRGKAELGELAGRGRRVTMRKGGGDCFAAPDAGESVTSGKEGKKLGKRKAKKGWICPKGKTHRGCRKNQNG